jgi:hypothetical protein
MSPFSSSPSSPFPSYPYYLHPLFPHPSIPSTISSHAIFTRSLIAIARYAPRSFVYHQADSFHSSSLVKSCTSKCIDPSYREADLNKGESVCLDRCVSKFFEVNVKVSEKMQGEAQGKQGGGGGGGMFGA